MYCFPSRLLLILGILLCLFVAPVRAQTTSNRWVEKPTIASPVNGQSRIALILGNTHYGGDHDLKNPENDARAMAKALAKLGFTSTVVLDGSLDQMSDAVHAFAGKIRSVGTSSVALLYYSGHGIQVNGENYLLPVDFKMPAYDQDMVRSALSAQSALDEMQEANAQVNIAILDACRNNPFAKDRAFGGKGLARLEAQGVMIAYATAAGTTASDNTDGQNGLYTAALLKYLQRPRLTLTSIFSRTRKAVYEASQKKQFPYIYDGLIDADQFYLLPAKTVAVVKNVAPIATPVDTTALLSVTTNVPEAKVLVNDTALSADGSYRTNLGVRKSRVVEVAVTADGYKPWIKRVTLLRGKTVQLPVMLAIVPPPVKKPLPKSAPAPAPTPPPSERPVGITDVLGLPAPRTLAEYKAQMARIPGGTFTMGSNDSKYADSDELPLHLVTVSSFKMGRTPVTVAMWREYCQATSRSMPQMPSWGWIDDHPIVNLSWYDAQAYCDWAGLKLPTEAQWEYAAKGGQGTRYPWGDSYDSSKLVCRSNAGGTTAPVYRRDRVFVNRFGLVDMGGNVWQWVSDWLGKYSSESQTDPQGVASGEKHVVRSSCFLYDDVDRCRAAYRGRNVPDKTGPSFSFRCAAPIP